jgi:DNA-binding transcriptional LysR family regulator
MAGAAALRVLSRNMEQYQSDGALLHYQAFLAVVEAGNLTRAAKRLRRSLQSVSRSLAALEEQLGVVLIRRTTRSAQPTDAGQRFYRRLSDAMREIGLAEAEVRDTSGALRGTLRLAGSAFFVGMHVVPAIREFSQQHPGVKFDLRIAESFADHVGDGIDVMIRIGQLPLSPLKARKLAALRRVVVASPGYLAQRGRPELPRDLERHRCIVRTSAQDSRAWTFYGPDGVSERVAIDGVLESDNAYVNNHAAIAGLGLAITPFFQVRDAVEAGRLEIVLPDFALAPAPVHAVMPSDAQTPARVRRFVELLAQRLKKELL